MAFGKIINNMPRTIVPHSGGRALPPEHLAYLNEGEMRLLKAMTDGHSNITPFGHVQSFADPSDSYGGDMSGTQTADNYNGSGPQPSSYSSYGDGYGNYGSYGAATGGGIGSDSGGDGPGNSNMGYNSKETNSYGGYTGGYGNYGSYGEAKGGGIGDSGGYGNSGGGQDKITYTPQGGKGDPLKSGIDSWGGKTDYVTANSVPSIPMNGGGATYTNDTQRAINLGQIPSISAASPMAIGGPSMVNPATPAPQANDTQPSSWNSPSRDQVDGGMTTGKSVDSGDGTSTAGAGDYGASNEIGWTDPRLGYFDQHNATPATQFADRLREDLQLQGIAPTDNGISGVMGNLMNEKLGPYLSQKSDPWVIGSPANMGQFPQIGSNPDSGGTLAFGAPQWNSGAGRLQQAKSFFDGNGLNPNDPNNQAAGIAAEIAGKFPGQTGDYTRLFNGLENMSPSQAASTWMRGYENPSYDPSINRVADRQASASQFAQNFPGSDFNGDPSNMIAMGGDPGAQVISPVSDGNGPQVADASPQNMTAMQGGLGMQAFGPSSMIEQQLALAQQYPDELNTYASVVPDYGYGQAPGPVQVAAGDANSQQGDLYGNTNPTTFGGLGPNQTENVPAELAAKIKSPALRRIAMAMATPRNDPQTLASMNAIQSWDGVGLGRDRPVPITNPDNFGGSQLTAIQRNVLQAQLQYATPERRAQILAILNGQQPYGMNFGVSYQAV